MSLACGEGDEVPMSNLKKGAILKLNLCLFDTMKVSFNGFHISRNCSATIYYNEGNAV